MEVKSTKKIIVVRMLDWAIVALVVLLFLIVLVGLTTNKPISFWGLEFNLNNNYAATERSNFIDNPNPVATTNTSITTTPVSPSAAAPNKVIPNTSNENSKPASNARTNTVVPSNNPAGTSSFKEEKPKVNQSNATTVIKTQKKDPVIYNEVVAPPQSYRSVRKSTYAASAPIKNENDYYNQVAQEPSAETNYSNSINGNPYINNGANRTPKESPRSNSGTGAGARNFSQSEMNEFMRQFSNKKTDIHFVNFGYLDAEMESVRAQILAALNKSGYTNIDANWNRYTDYTTINEVHFGVNGYSGANFYIPKAKN